MSLKDIWDKITGAQKREDDEYRQASVDKDNQKDADKRAAKDQAEEKAFEKWQAEIDRERHRKKEQGPAERMTEGETQKKIADHIKAGRPPSSAEHQPAPVTEKEATRLEHTPGYQAAPLVMEPGVGVKPNNRSWQPKQEPAQASGNENVPKPNLTAELTSPLSPQEQAKWQKSYGDAKVTHNLQPERDRSRSL